MQMSELSPIVLVIDDEIQIRRFLRTGFELNGFVVHEAGTGTEGIRAATLRPIDIVIVDLGLPDMDGSEVVERIRSWSTVPIIVLSVRSTEAQKVRLLEIGADDYVVKPFGIAELLARVRVALAPPVARRIGRACRHRRPADHRSRRPRGDAQWHAPGADPEGIPAVAGARPARRQRGHASASC